MRMRDRKWWVYRRQLPVRGHMGRERHVCVVERLKLVGLRVSRTSGEGRPRGRGSWNLEGVGRKKKRSARKNKYSGR